MKLAVPVEAGAVGGGDGDRVGPGRAGRAGDGPVLGSMAKPAGRPVAAQVVMVAVEDESVALKGDGGDGATRVADWAPGW